MLIGVSTILFLGNVHAGGVVKARFQNSKYKAKAKATCPVEGTNSAKRVTNHPVPAIAFVRNPSNSLLTFGASMESAIGPGGWWMTPNVSNIDCTTGGHTSDFAILNRMYRIVDRPVESGDVHGESILFEPGTKSVSITHIAGAIEINSISRFVSFYITIWENPEDNDEDWELPTQNLLWQGSATFFNGQLTLDGFTEEEIYVQNGNQIVFDGFTKSFVFPGANFGSIEVDIRYETEEEGQMLISAIAEQTARLTPDRLTVAPNPAEGQILISISPVLTVAETYNLRIFDHVGRFVLELGDIALHPGTQDARKQADISQLSGGLYYVSASSSSQVLVVGFIKKQ